MLHYKVNPELVIIPPPAIQPDSPSGQIDDPKRGLPKFIALENYLSDLLGIKVDLVEKQALKPAIGRHVAEEVEGI